VRPPGWGKGQGANPGGGGMLLGQKISDRVAVMIAGLWWRACME